MTPEESMMQLEELKAARVSRELKDFPIPVEALCNRYEDLRTPLVNDALREKNKLNQVLPHTIMPLRDEMRVAGIAFTIKGTKSLTIEQEMEKRTEMLDAIPRNSTIVWDTSNDDGSAQWGEVMTQAAIKKGCRGAVVDGGVRDTNRVLEQNFPVFVRYRTSNGMLGRFRILGYQIPIQIGDVCIRPGDVVLGDVDGVIVVPRDLAHDVLLRAEEIENEESVIKKWIREGMSTSEVVRRGGYF